ncbi:lactate utilization protein [Chitinivorax sp. B]|uniref:LutC/YkgG family protein n=1 Tax=Chitinivorax sp. B TaxID=2502235 RepID=UPI0010F9AAFB|nr:lactate utilization protein [Chitinivorax sp. B]
MTARDRILAKLRQGSGTAPAPLPLSDYQAATTPYTFSHPEDVARVISLLRAAHAEVIETTAQRWPNDVVDTLHKLGIRQLLLAPNTPAATTLQVHWAGRNDTPQIKRFDQHIEQWKAELFQIEASLTGCEGAIAATGSLVLWPTAAEPRTLSLVPPIHMVLWHTGQLWNTLLEAMQQAEWATRLPTNVLLISGPSKTADIQQTLAYGAHGPKQLIVLAILDELP